MGRRDNKLNYAVVELDGIRYAIVREATLGKLCRRAGVTPVGPTLAADPIEPAPAAFDGIRLARRIVDRRRRAGLTQAALARRAGIRIETLNRLERGRTNPDFATLRKLVVAMARAEAEVAHRELAGASVQHTGRHTAG